MRLVFRFCLSLKVNPQMLERRSLKAPITLGVVMIVLIVVLAVGGVVLDDVALVGLE